jgi:hypothetical protein
MIGRWEIGGAVVHVDPHGGFGAFQCRSRPVDRVRNLYPVMRLGGAEIGISLMATWLRVREQIHSNFLGQHVMDGSVDVNQMLAKTICWPQRRRGAGAGARVAILDRAARGQYAGLHRRLLADRLVCYRGLGAGRHDRPIARGASYAGRKLEAPALEKCDMVALSYNFGAQRK